MNSLYTKTFYTLLWKVGFIHLKINSEDVGMDTRFLRDKIIDA